MKALVEKGIDIYFLLHQLPGCGAYLMFNIPLQMGSNDFLSRPM